MDYTAINTLVSKAYYRGDKIGSGVLDEDTVGITVDGLVAWFIPEKDFLFDTEKISEIKLNLSRVVATEGYVDATLTNTLIAFEKKTLVVFKADELEVYVDKKLLKVFDPRLSSYKVKNATSGVLVYEGDKLVGYVMPTRYNKQ